MYMSIGLIDPSSHCARTCPRDFIFLGKDKVYFSKVMSLQQLKGRILAAVAVVT